MGCLPKTAVWITLYKKLHFLIKFNKPFSFNYKQQRQPKSRDLTVVVHENLAAAYGEGEKDSALFQLGLQNGKTF
jgi:hypothetical protein